MIYSFLTSEDLRVAIKLDALNTASENDSSNIIKAEKRAVEYMKSFMNQRYNVEDTFPLIRQWVINKDYKISLEETFTGTDELGAIVTETFTPLYYRVAGEIVNYVYHLGKFYKAVADNTGVIPGTDETKWTEEDPRSEVVVGFCMDITLYYLHQKISTRKIPETRIDAYNQAKEWIVLIQEAEITPDLPKPRDIKKDIDTIQWGSGPQKGHYY